jgi:5'-nucleotidase
VIPSAVAGLRFGDEAETVNALVPKLKAEGVEAIVVLVHEGGAGGGGPDECPSVQGRIVDIVKRLDRAVDVVVSGHTHRSYVCRIDGRLVTSAESYGTMLTKIDLVLDPATRDVARSEARNVIVRHDAYPPDPKIASFVEGYEKLAVPLARRVVGPIGGALARTIDAAGQMPAGLVIADAQLAATRDAGAQLALMNPGGVRAPLARADDGLVRYEDLFTMQPFSNHLVTMTLSGAELAELLEQQWTATTQRILLPSEGLTYAWDAGRPVGSRLVPGSLMLDGRPVVPADRVRITVNSFLASGGDGFTVLRRGSAPRVGVNDVDALEAYVRSRPTLQAPATPRIVRVN